MSTTFRWRIILALPVILIAFGALVAGLLALGLADPPHIGTRQFDTVSPDSWKTRDSDEFMVFEAPVTLPATFTLELIAQNDGPPDSAWGIQLLNDKNPLSILVDNQGHFSVQTAEQPDWTEFPHIYPNGANKISFHVEIEGKTTLRINDEIATDTVKLANFDGSAWATIAYRQPELTWERIVLYHE